MTASSALHSINFIAIVAWFMVAAITAMVMMSGFEPLRVTGHFYFSALLIPLPFSLYIFSVKAMVRSSTIASAQSPSESSSATWIIFSDFETARIAPFILSLLGVIDCLAFIIVQIVMLAKHGSTFSALLPTVVPYVVLWVLFGVMLIVCCILIYLTLNVSPPLPYFESKQK